MAIESRNLEMQESGGADHSSATQRDLARLQLFDPFALNRLHQEHGTLSAVDFHALLERTLEAEENAIREANKPFDSIDPEEDPFELSGTDHAMMLAQAHAMEARGARATDQTFLYDYDEQIRYLNYEINELRQSIQALETQNTQVTQQLQQTYANIAEFRASLSEEDLAILDDRVAGKPLVVIDATLPGGAQGQSYVVYEDQNGERYIKDPQDPSGNTHILVSDLSEPDKSQAEQDIKSQEDMGQKFGNEDPALAARFEKGEKAYQAKPELRKGLEDAIRNQKTGKIDQFDSVVRKNEIENEIEDKQEQIDEKQDKIEDLEQQKANATATADAGTVQTEQLNYDPDPAADARAAELTKALDSYKAAAHSGMVVTSDDLAADLGRDLTPSELALAAEELEASGIKFADNSPTLDNALDVTLNTNAGPVEPDSQPTTQNAPAPAMG